MSHHERTGGATRETIIDVIKRRLGGELIDYALTFGLDSVADALDNAAEAHYGCEEIGSSDTYFMVESFKSYFPHAPEPRTPEFRANFRRMISPRED